MPFPVLVDFNPLKQRTIIVSGTERQEVPYYDMFPLSVSPQDISENGSDCSHLEYLHGPFMGSGSDLRYMDNKLVQSSKNMFTLGPFHVAVVVVRTVLEFLTVNKREKTFHKTCFYNSLCDPSICVCELSMESVSAWMSNCHKKTITARIDWIVD